MGEYLPKPNEHSSRNIRTKLDLFNYATTKIERATGVNISNLVSKSDLASLKAEVDEIDIDELKAVPGD